MTYGKYGLLHPTIRECIFLLSTYKNVTKIAIYWYIIQIFLSADIAWNLFSSHTVQLHLQNEHNSLKTRISNFKTISK